MLGPPPPVVIPGFSLLSFPVSLFCHSRGSGNPKCRDPQDYKDFSFPESPGQARR